ncbi:RagB/SusD family nutrient uptake outer membrane protein [Desertivirga xinjiangensis]|uniref:RagB/SusD family nutrient uptake outer membrane protein n=1 Tax=Desertivirga xinjiangensis TaxID=539206 RepID=UPI00210AEF49|nr:RagB/SusD family nutrient uptake outer membrane protein [Pedobacter xinjiangensis]
MNIFTKTMQNFPAFNTRRGKCHFIPAVLVALLCFCSCRKDGFLDNKSEEELDETHVFSDSSRTMDFLANVYIGCDYNIQLGIVHNTSDFEKLTDLAEGRYPAAGNFDKQVTLGIFNQNFYTKINDDWKFLYNKIRQANIFLKNINHTPLSHAMKLRTSAEIRFLRAWYYHFLMKYFGGVPLVYGQILSTEMQPDTRRNSYQECVEYMVSELDHIAPILPALQTGRDYGRVSRGAALALKSRILITAASPLFNGGSTSDNPDLIMLTSYPVYDKNRWKEAYLAAKEVMEMNLYALMTDNNTRPGNGFYKVFLTRVNNEFIFFRSYPPGKIMELAHNPKSRGGAWYFDYPTQQLVDMFPMRNGKAIGDPDSGYDPKDPYTNRDPRLGYTVMYNGSLYYLNSTKTLSPVYTYEGQTDGIIPSTSNSGTTTGYYHRKMCDELAAVSGGGNVDRAVPLIRYAEILLNYAEAANETGLTREALEQLKILRARAGIIPGENKNYGLPQSPSQQELRELIRNERAIELAFEGLWFWDLCRSKTGTRLDGKYTEGMHITLTGSEFKYSRIPLRKRYFKENLYLLPIPDLELSLNTTMLQNPGW